MFKITKRAARQLKTALSKAEDPEGTCFRIGVADSQVKLVVDQERPGDTTIEHEGKILVVIDPAAGNVLSNRKLDFDDGASGLVLKEIG
jgi:Fe-S cluster assembly iron-binding protein IscA